MENHNSSETNREISKVIKSYQSERVSGQWYIEQTGLNKVAKLIGGDYKKLTKKQRIEFRADCLNNAFGYIDVRSWWYYLNCA
jgi:hypothetical protein